MFLHKHKHKNTTKFFLFFGKSVQKWSEKRMPPHHCEGIPKDCDYDFMEF